MTEGQRKIEFLKRAVEVDYSEYYSMAEEWAKDPEEYHQIINDATLDGLMMAFDGLSDADYIKYISAYEVTLYKVKIVDTFEYVLYRML